MDTEDDDCTVFESLEPLDLDADFLVSRPPVGPAGTLHGTLPNGMTCV